MRSHDYQLYLKELDSLISSNDHFISNLSNFNAFIMSKFNYHWVGFYLKDETKDLLYLGPFQGPVACTIIPNGKGVCGTSFHENKIMNVPNVHEFSGHIACSALSNSELVVPFSKDGKVCGVLDIDSTEFDHFSPEDETFFQEAISILESSFS